MKLKIFTAACILIVIAAVTTLAVHTQPTLPQDMAKVIAGRLNN